MLEQGWKVLVVQGGMRWLCLLGAVLSLVTGLVARSAVSRSRRSDGPAAMPA